LQSLGLDFEGRVGQGRREKAKRTTTKVQYKNIYHGTASAVPNLRTVSTPRGGKGKKEKFCTVSAIGSRLKRTFVTGSFETGRGKNINHPFRFFDPRASGRKRPENNGQQEARTWLLRFSSGRPPFIEGSPHL